MAIIRFYKRVKPQNIKWADETFEVCKQVVNPFIGNDHK